jgi:hypothetical protein
MPNRATVPTKQRGGLSHFRLRAARISAASRGWRSVVSQF